MKWHVYMLQLRNGTIYIGHTNDLTRRLSEHRTARGSKATKDSKPTELIYSEEHPDRVSAVRRERQLKKWSRAKKLALTHGDLRRLHQHAKPTKKTTMTDQPAFSVVVYCEPGPDDAMIAAHARTVLEAHSRLRKAQREPGDAEGGLGYVTFVASDFEQLWDGVDRGDALGTAYAVLRFLGPTAEQFIGRVDDFMFGWIGGEDKEYGNVLLLQIFPRSHLLAKMN